MPGRVRPVCLRNRAELPIVPRVTADFSADSEIFPASRIEAIESDQSVCKSRRDVVPAHLFN